MISVWRFSQWQIALSQVVIRFKQISFNTAKVSVMKYFLILVLIMYFSPNLYSQIINNYGLKIGLTSANQQFDYTDIIIDDQKFGVRKGINVSFFAEMMEVNHFSFVLNLSYNQKGMIDKIVMTKVWGNEDGFISEKQEFDNRLDYLTISTNIKTRYELLSFTPYILTGIKYDVLLGKKIDHSFHDLEVKYDFYDRLYDQYDGNILGLTFGIGIENQEIVGIPILIEWIYYHDLTKIKINENLKIQNLSNELMIGIKF